MNLKQVLIKIKMNLLRKSIYEMEQLCEIFFRLDNIRYRENTNWIDLSCSRAGSRKKKKNIAITLLDVFELEY